MLVKFTTNKNLIRKCRSALFDAVDMVEGQVEMNHQNNDWLCVKCVFPKTYVYVRGTFPFGCCK